MQIQLNWKINSRRVRIWNIPNICGTSSSIETYILGKRFFIINHSPQIRLSNKTFPLIKQKPYHSYYLININFSCTSAKNFSNLLKYPQLKCQNIGMMEWTVKSYSELWVMCLYINDVETFSAFKLQGIRKFILHTIAITFTFRDRILEIDFSLVFIFSFDRRWINFQYKNMKNVIFHRRISEVVYIYTYSYLPYMTFLSVFRFFFLISDSTK